MHELLDVVGEVFLELVSGELNAVIKGFWSVLEEFDTLGKGLDVLLRDWVEIDSFIQYLKC